MKDVEKSFWPKMKSQQHKRRNISGIYIFDKFPTDEKRHPTCIEDCRQETRRSWVMGQGDKETAKQAIKMVYDAFIELCDYLHKEGCITDGWHKDLTDMANKKKEEVKYNWGLHELASLLDVACDKLCLCADSCGVSKERKMSEQELFGRLEELEREPRYCRTCKHRKRFPLNEYSNKVVQCCDLQRSHRSNSGYKTIKVTDTACGFYEEKVFNKRYKELKGEKI